MFHCCEGSETSSSIGTIPNPNFRTLTGVANRLYRIIEKPQLVGFWMSFFFLMEPLIGLLICFLNSGVLKSFQTLGVSCLNVISMSKISYVLFQGSFLSGNIDDQYER